MARAPSTEAEPHSPSDGTRLARRLLDGTTGHLVAFALRAGSTVVMLPLFLAAWGVEVYGEWMALYALVGYLNNLDFGVTAAATNAATMAYAREDWSEFKRIQGTAWAVTVSLAGLGLVLTGAVLVFLPAAQLLGLAALPAGEAQIVATALAASLLLGLPCHQLTRVYVAAGKYTTYVYLTNVFSLASSLLLALLLLGGARPGVVAVAVAAQSAGTILVVWWLLQRTDSRLVPRLRDADRATARGLAAPTLHFGVSILAAAAALHGPVLLLSRFAGGAAVAVFTTSRTVVNMTRQGTGLLRYPLRPELAALDARGESERLGRLFRISTGLDAVINVSLLSALWYAGPWIVNVWSQGKITVDAPFFRLLLGALLLEGFLATMAQIAVATNRLGRFVAAQAFSTAGWLALALFLLPAFGLTAIPLAMLPFLALVVAPVAAREACSQAGFQPKLVASRILVPFALAAGLSVGLSETLLRGVREWPWLAGTLAGVLGLTLSLLLIGLRTLDWGDRKACRVIAGQVLRAYTPGAAS